MVSYVGAGVFATFFIGMIIVLPLWFAGFKARMAERFESVYVPVDVEISLSELRKKKSFSGTKDGVGHWYYWPEIQFDYTVQGQHFNTGVYSPSHMIGQTGESSDEMREIIANYPVGSTHTARAPRLQHGVLWWSRGARDLLHRDDHCPAALVRLVQGPDGRALRECLRAGRC